MFEEEYTFENFVTGPENSLAVACCNAVVEGCSRNYNPLYIYGSGGSGKTHLLHAVEHYLSEHRPDVVVRHWTADGFAAELSDAIYGGTLESFRKEYMGADYVFIDDIDRFADKPVCHDELLSLIICMREREKQMIFTSMLPPKKLPGFSDRLKSKFSKGMIVDIRPVDRFTSSV